MGLRLKIGRRGAGNFPCQIEQIRAAYPAQCRLNRRVALEQYAHGAEFACDLVGIFLAKRTNKLRAIR